MKFELHNLYKNIYKDPETAFTVDEIISQNLYGAELVVTWFKLTEGGRYVSIGVSGEFFVPKDQVLYYVAI